MQRNDGELLHRRHDEELVSVMLPDREINRSHSGLPCNGHPFRRGPE